MSRGKFFFDQIYNVLVVWPLEGLARLAAWFDNHVIDGLVNLVGALPAALGRVLRPHAGRHGPVLRLGHGAGAAGFDRGLVDVRCKPSCSSPFSCRWRPPCCRADSPRSGAWRALAATLATLALAVVLVGRYPPGAQDFALTDVAWLAAAGVPVDVRFSIALDGLSLWLFGLTALLMVVAVLVSWEAIRQQQSLYYRLLLVLETGMLGVFVARDIILFYLFFEFTLIPLFFLIGIWGSEQRRYAAVKFFLFTLAGSVLTLLGLLAIVLWNYQHGPANR